MCQQQLQAVLGGPAAVPRRAQRTPSSSALAAHLAWPLPCHHAAPALKLPVFINVPAVGTAGARTTLTLPASVASYDRLELDFTLGCPGPNDTSCPLWDHVLQLYVYCNNPDGSQPAADPCTGTPFAPFVPDGARAGGRLRQG